MQKIYQVKNIMEQVDIFLLNNKTKLDLIYIYIVKYIYSLLIFFYNIKSNILYITFISTNLKTTFSL